MKWTFAVIVVLLLWLMPSSGALASGLDGEISLMGSFSKTDYGNNSYSTTRRYTATAGINLLPVTELELSYSYTDTFFNADPVQTSSVNEQALGLSIVQALLPPKLFLQPYIKAGAAQYNRKQSGTTAGIPTTPTSSKAPSGILGGGIRIFLLHNFSLKVEGVAYLPNFNVSKAINNFSIQGGISWNY